MMGRYLSWRNIQTGIGECLENKNDFKGVQVTAFPDRNFKVISSSSLLVFETCLLSIWLLFVIQLAVLEQINKCLTCGY